MSKEEIELKKAVIDFLKTGGFVLSKSGGFTFLSNRQNLPTCSSLYVSFVIEHEDDAFGDISYEFFEKVLQNIMREVWMK